MRRTLLASLSVVCAAALAAPAGLQSVTIRLNLAQGAKYRYRSVSNMSMTGASAAGNSSTKQTLSHSLLVKKATPSGYTVTTTVTDVKVEGSGSMGGMKDRLEKTLKGKTYDTEYAKTGKVVKMDMKSLGGGVMGGMQGLDVGFLGVQYPASPVGVGSKWASEIDLKKMFASMPMGNMMKFTSGGKFPVKYTLKNFRNGGRGAVIGFTISGNATMAIDMPKQGQTGGGKMTITMNLSLTGSADVDVASGLPNSVVSSGAMKMNMMGMAMNQKMSSTVTRL